MEKLRPLPLQQKMSVWENMRRVHHIPLRSDTALRARIKAKVVDVTTLLSWGRSNSVCPLGVVIAVSLVFFGGTAEISS